MRKPMSVLVILASCLLLLTTTTGAQVRNEQPDMTEEGNENRLM